MQRYGSVDQCDKEAISACETRNDEKVNIDIPYQSIS
jgi:hypothetical protein